MLHDWLERREAIWLFYILMGELLVSIYSAIILTVEYFWGRSDTDIKREVVRKKAARAKQKAEEAQAVAPPPTEVVK